MHTVTLYCAYIQYVYTRITAGTSHFYSVPLQLLRFKEDNAGQLGSATTSLEQALERTIANMNWVDMNKEQVLQWFTNENEASS